MNNTQRTEQFIVYSKRREDAISLAKELMHFRGAQIDVERISDGQWMAYVYSHEAFAI